MSGMEPSTKKIFVYLFLTLNFLFLVTSSGRVRTIDEVSVDLQTESLAMHGNTAVPQAEAIGTFYGKRDRWGQARAPYGTAQAAVTVPWYYAGRILRTVLPGVPEKSKDVFLDAVVTASSATFAALVGALSFLLFVRMGLGERKALWAALIVALGTPIFAYSSWFFSEPLTAAVLLGVTLALFGGGEEAEISVGQGALAGLLLGFATWVRPTHVIVVPAFLVALLIHDRKKTARAAMALAAVAGVFAVAYLVRNQIYFGNPMEFGYPDAAEGGKRLNTFETPLLTGLMGFLFSPGKSVFLFAPVVLLAIAGIPKLAKQHLRIAIVAVVIPLEYLLFFAKYTQWEGGYCAGPRYLVPAIPLLCLGLGPIFGDRGSTVKKIALILFCGGLLVQVVSISTSFLEDQANGSYYDKTWNYKMSYAPMVSQTKLLVHYVASPEPAKLGRGFDRWFVFLAKTGVARGLLAVGLAMELCGLAAFAWKLREAISKDMGSKVWTGQIAAGRKAV